jgi:signal transduction histidine kinase
LGLVSLSSQTLRRRLQKTDVAGWQTSVNRIDRACASMERLIGDVLSAANIESETFAVRPQWLAADAFLMDVGQALDPLCQAAGLRFTLRGVSDGLRVYGDEDRLHQAIGNLVSNAIRFTPEGGTIAVGLSQQQGEVHITVSDSGQGISKAKISKIFDQFWQGDQGVQSGAGLGLFIVRGIVLAHGGRIWADSEVGQGTTFTFTCPAPS